MVPTVRMRVTVGELRGEALPLSLQVVFLTQAAKLNVGSVCRGVLDSLRIVAEC